ncbi:MAG: histidine--tRNA ligase family protein, partial [Planctomycetaceae bacterium]|nr:histidine--tRNA ligase family protein [Planctomycetaceae bacterium]
GNSFKIHVNNRKVLSGLLDKYGIADKSVPVLRALDKLAKIGKDGVYKELTGQYNEQESVFPALSETQANAVLQLADIHGSNDEILAALATVLDGNALGEEGVEQLAGLCNVFSTLQTDRLMIDVSIARGLDYYTGTIYETFLDALPAIGSVCSGGRYDNLAGLFTKQELPGIGASLGLDRLLAAMEELGLLPKAATPIDIFIPLFVESRLGDYLKIADGLRKRGIGVEVFHEAKKLGQQLKYADRRGYKFAVIIGEDEFAKGVAKVKNLQTQTSTEYPLNNITLSAT